MGIKVGIRTAFDRSCLERCLARALNRMTVRTVQSLKAVGRHSDGGGLYLRITPKGAKSWVFMTNFLAKRVEIGLGSANALPLAKARELASQMREAAATGRDPREALKSEPALEALSVLTFGEFAERYISGVEEGWRNSTHRQQWRNSLRDHASALRNVPIPDVSTEDVLAALRPIWVIKAETAKRVRARIERILDAAKAQGLRSLEVMNPATWRGHLEYMLPPPTKLARGHHAALPWKEAPSFIALLRSRPALAARCLEFVILTAARSGEALGASWGEVDLNTKLWTIPAQRMKAGVEHVVPLSDAALQLLIELRQGSPLRSDLVFSIRGAKRSNMAIAMLLRRMGHGHVTTHGFRSTFRDWAGDATSYPRELIEQALAHTIQNKAERAYRRGTAIERRRALMRDWTDFLEQPTEQAEHNGAP